MEKSKVLSRAAFQLASLKSHAPVCMALDDFTFKDCEFASAHFHMDLPLRVDKKALEGSRKSLLLVAESFGGLPRLQVIASLELRLTGGHVGK